MSACKTAQGEDTDVQELDDVDSGDDTAEEQDTLDHSSTSGKIFN